MAPLGPLGTRGNRRPGPHAPCARPRRYFVKVQKNMLKCHKLTTADVVEGDVLGDAGVASASSTHLPSGAWLWPLGLGGFGRGPWPGVAALGMLLNLKGLGTSRDRGVLDRITLAAWNLIPGCLWVASTLSTLV